ncbi:MAG: PASTA domain-containing protein, partial [Acidimicrobiia bacterium]
YTNGGTPGRVMFQSPGAGTRVARGSSVSLVVGR